MMFFGWTIVGLGVLMDLANVRLAYRYGVLRRGASPIIGLPIALYVGGAILLVVADIDARTGQRIAVGGIVLHLLSWVPTTLYCVCVRWIGRK